MALNIQDHLKQDYGQIQIEFKLNQFEVKIYTSNQRDRVNPFSAQFPFLVNRVDNCYHISISPKIDLVILESELVKHNPSLEAQKLDVTFLSEMFDCKMLDVNRYFINSKITESNVGYIFTSLTQIEIDNLSKLCKISKAELQKLNLEHKVFLNLRADEIVGYGFITREFDNVVEISVATVKAERGKGIGFETVRSMTELILRSGKSILYISEVANVASNKIALKCGYELVAEEILGFRNNNK